MRLVLVRRQWIVPVMFILALITAAVAGWQATDGSRRPAPAPPPAAPAAGIVQDRAAAAGDAFYVDCRLDRERSRGRQVEYLREIINDTKAAAEERKEAQNELLRITREIERETSTENILRARGFPDVAVLFQGRTVTVVLPQSLNADERTSVITLVARGTGVAPEDVMVIDRAGEGTGTPR
ncbi:MAG: SpoIIIAH-like family protein [Thermoanaerobacterales bacterium]|nr:SpoIIIAH-like family protein [Bacillota bacterium]MDI6906764.1 SpoIIIAH-like family protein [Thermoanaerobacterales bacterium]